MLEYKMSQTLKRSIETVVGAKIGPWISGGFSV